MTDALLQFESVWQAVGNALRLLAMSGHTDEPTSHRKQLDVELVAAAVSGDGDAFGKIVDLHQESIASQMRRFSRDQTVIEELVHDVFVEAYMSLKSYRASSPLLHWLRKIAVRVGYRYWKQQSRPASKAVQLSQVEEIAKRLTSPADGLPTDASETLDQMLSLLSPPDRLVLTLIYWDGCSVAEAADLAGWSQSKVKVQTHRARKKLRKLIEESLP